MSSKEYIDTSTGEIITSLPRQTWHVGRPRKPPHPNTDLELALFVYSVVVTALLLLVVTS